MHICSFSFIITKLSLSFSVLHDKGTIVTFVPSEVSLKVKANFLRTFSSLKKTSGNIVIHDYQGGHGLEIFIIQFIFQVKKFQNSSVYGAGEQKFSQNFKVLSMRFFLIFLCFYCEVRRHFYNFSQQLYQPYQVGHVIRNSN